MKVPTDPAVIMYYKVGGFMGHLLPGIGVCVISIWWSINIIGQHLQTCRINSRAYQAHFYYVSTLTRRFPLESVIKMILAVILTTEEARIGYRDGKFVTNDSRPHIAIYSSIFMNGLLEVLHFRRARSNAEANQMLEPVGVLVTVSTTAFVFNFHLQNSPPLHTLLHILFVTNAVVVIVCILLESWCSKWATCSMARVIATQMVGTWLIQVGFILYPEIFGWQKWDENDPILMQLSLVLYFLHWIANCGWALLMSAIIRKRSTSYKMLTVDRQSSRS